MCPGFSPHLRPNLTLSLATSEWKKRPPFEVCLKLCIKTVPAGAFSASIDLPSRHWERTAVDMQIISLVPSLPLPPTIPVPSLNSLPPIFTPSLLCKRMLMPNVNRAELYVRQCLSWVSNVCSSLSVHCCGWSLSRYSCFWGEFMNLYKGKLVV